MRAVPHVMCLGVAKLTTGRPDRTPDFDGAAAAAAAAQTVPSIAWFLAVLLYQLSERAIRRRWGQLDTSAS